MEQKDTGGAGNNDGGNGGGNGGGGSIGEAHQILEGTANNCVEGEEDEHGDQAPHTSAHGIYVVLQHYLLARQSP